MLGWTQRELAEHAGLALASVNTLEREVLDPRVSTLRKVQTTLEAAGIEFTDTGGVALRDPMTDRTGARRGTP
jgi:predicted transcriptional regulator